MFVSIKPKLILATKPSYVNLQFATNKFVQHESGCDLLALNVSHCTLIYEGACINDSAVASWLLDC